MTPPRAASVIICTRNRADRLRVVLGCLQAQDYARDRFEVLVVDNNSTDGTAEVVRRFAETSNMTVRSIFEPGTHITTTRNNGAAAAHHPYLVFIDDDCTMNPDWLTLLMSGFDLDERVVAVGGLVRLHWEAPRPDWVGPDVARWLADTSYLGTEARILGPEERVVEANTAFSRDAFRRAGGFLGMELFGSRNMASGEVIHLLHQMRAAGGLLALAPGAVAQHHVTPPPKSRLLRRCYWQGVSDVMLDAIDNHKRPGIPARIGRASRELAAEIFALAALSLLLLRDTLRRDSAKAMFQLTRIARRVGVIATLLRLAGDWKRAANWQSQPTAAEANRLMEEFTL